MQKVPEPPEKPEIPITPVDEKKIDSSKEKTILLDETAGEEIPDDLSEISDEADDILNRQEVS